MPLENGLYRCVQEYFWLLVYVTLGPGFLLKKQEEPGAKKTAKQYICMQKLGVTVKTVFSSMYTHTSDSRHSSLYKCTLRSSPDKRNTVSHLPSARILWQGTMTGEAKTRPHVQ